MSFNPAPIRASSSKPDPNRNRKPSSANWWAPLFGWQSEPDYTAKNEGSDSDPEPESESSRRRSRLFPGYFTEEKAKQLRRKTLEGLTFHDAMYYSTIESRLALDLSDRKDEK